ncbi:MAG TPA: EutN/CcmL family microcompartment protein [Kiritimatiellia bacterium]|nr:EutN/CcmL family microcompartment protein [Kiritimatiellia bacterium]
MIIGKVIGDIYSTINHPFFNGKKLLVVERITPEGKPAGDYIIAVDSVGAGVGEQVLVVDEGNSARQIIGSTTAPLRSIIVGIIDEISV